MIGFEIPFARQLANVLEGRTASGTRPSTLYRLPKMDAFTDLRRVLAETTAWTLYGLPDELRAREELRTFVIWSTAAHLWRLTRQGYNLTRASQEAEWMSRAIAAHPGFLATTLFARKAMPELAAFNLVKDRAALRARTFNTYLAIQAVSRMNCHMPERTAFTYRYTVYRHRTPQDFQDYSAVADRWRAHLDAIIADTETDHGYWVQVARGERMLFTYATGGVRKASFDLYLGNVIVLDLHEPVHETTYDLLATALVHLGTVLKLPFESPNTVIQKLLAAQGKDLRAADSPTATPDTTETFRGLSRRATPQPATSGKPTCTVTTDKLLAIAVLFVALSYLIPVSILAVPQLFSRQAWRGAPGVPPNCATPCPSTAPSPLPIPPRTGAKP